MTTGLISSRNAHATVANGSTPTGRTTWTTSTSSSTMTTVRAASNATLSVASVPRKAVARQEEALREVVAQEVALREAVPLEDRLRETQAVVAVAPAVTKMTITHLAAEAEAVGDNGYV